MDSWYSSPRPALFAPSRGTAWVLIVLGILAVLAGIAALIWPGLTLLNLVLLFGWFAIITGILEIVHAFTSPSTTEGKVLLGVRGLITLILGIWALLLPGATLGAFIVLIAAYFFITGVLQIIAAFRGHVHLWLLVWGILGVLAGIAAISYPRAAALTIAVIFGVYAILAGISAISSGVHILRHTSGHSTGSTRLHARAH
jgi:uncharacterized membrane protein HdeD (DUF308 family)